MLDMNSPYDIYLIAAFIFTQFLPQVRQAEVILLQNSWANYSWIAYLVPFMALAWYYSSASVVLEQVHTTFADSIPRFDRKLLFIPLIASFHLISVVRKVEYNLAACVIQILRWTPVFTVTLILLGAYYKPALPTNYANILDLDFYTKVFLALTIFKFLKVIVHLLSYLAYRPARAPKHRTLNSRDVTVIVPTVGDLGLEFQECIRSILANNPRQVIVSVVGPAAGAVARTMCSRLGAGRCLVIVSTTANKRVQVVNAANSVRTKIVCFADDHVFWPTTFLESALVPFEDPAVGLVGTSKRVRRDRGGSMFNSLLNYIACLYLERHNFECTGSNNIDGGVFAISGRTSLARAHIVHEGHFQESFLNETWMFGTVGPLGVDDGNFITRWMVTYGHKIVFHNAPEACIETNLGLEGDVKMFQGQLNCWERTIWRSNFTTLFADRTVWNTQPWCVYAVYLSAFVNLALFYDAALFYTLYRAFGTPIFPKFAYLALALFLSKMIKPFPFYKRNPKDLPLIPVGIAFGYYHSLIKLYSFFTCTNVAWGTRKGVDGNASAPDNGATGPGAGNATPARVNRGFREEIESSVAIFGHDSPDPPAGPLVHAAGPVFHSGPASVPAFDDFHRSVIRPASVPAFDDFHRSVIHPASGPVFRSGPASVPAFDDFHRPVISNSPPPGPTFDNFPPLAIRPATQQTFGPVIRNSPPPGPAFHSFPPLAIRPAIQQNFGPVIHNSPPPVAPVPAAVPAPAPIPVTGPTPAADHGFDQNFYPASVSASGPAPVAPAAPAVPQPVTPARKATGLPTPSKTTQRQGSKVFRKGERTTPRKGAVSVDYKKYF